MIALALAVAAIGCHPVYLTAAPTAQASERCDGNVQAAVYVGGRPAAQVEFSRHAAVFYRAGTIVRVRLAGTPGRLTVSAATTQGRARVRVQLLRPPAPAVRVGPPPVPVIPASRLPSWFWAEQA